MITLLITVAVATILYGLYLLHKALKDMKNFMISVSKTIDLIYEKLDFEKNKQINHVRETFTVDNSDMPEEEDSSSIGC